MEEIRRFPSAIYLDTSVVAAAIIEGVSHHAAARSFCNQLIHNESRICFSQLLHLELLQAVRTFGTVSGAVPEATQKQFRLSRWNRDLEVRQGWMIHCAERYDALLSDFEYVYEVPMRSDEWRNSIALMCQYHLKSYDAYHAAAALALGVYDLATIDAHFTRVSELTVHLVRDPEPPSS